MNRLLRVGLTAAAFFLPLALAAFALSQPAYPQSSTHPKGHQSSPVPIPRDKPKAPQARPAPCAPHAHIVGLLGSRFGEARRGIGVVSPQAVLEVFISDTGSWTVTVTDTRGIACVLAAGQYWQDIAPVAPPIPGMDS